MTSIIDVHVDSTTYAHATATVLDWSTQRESRYVCAANVHMLMEAYDDSTFRDVINRADLVTPDGMPLVWMMRFKGARNQQRVYGPTLMLHVLESAAESGAPVGFYGGAPAVLERLAANSKKKFTGLNVVYQYSPPYRDLDVEEMNQVAEQVNKSGVGILFVGLGCPKQEKWMSVQRGKINAVMLGVGAAFNFHAGVKPQAPAWLQRIGLEWLYRLAVEPRRLWKRYLYHNPRFILLATLDLLGMIH